MIIKCICSQPLFNVDYDRGALLSLAIASKHNKLLVSAQDGSGFAVDWPAPNGAPKAAPKAAPNGAPKAAPGVELTGPDCDPVYKVAVNDAEEIFSCCRDGIIRRYTLSILNKF
jgi:hypothetical protein